MPKRNRLPKLHEPYEPEAPKLRCVTESVSRALSFSFEEHFGWAIFTWNDSTGEFSVQSDWGNFSYRWHVGHLGCPTLTEFLAVRADVHYIANKLGIPPRAFDGDGTKRQLVHLLAELRKERDCTKEEARSARTLIDHLCYDVTENEFLHSVDRESPWLDFRDRYGRSSRVGELFDCTPDGSLSCAITTQPNPQYIRFTKHLLPLFQTEVKKRFLDPQAAKNDPPSVPA